MAKPRNHTPQPGKPRLVRVTPGESKARRQAWLKKKLSDPRFLGNPDVMFGAGPSLERDVMFAVHRLGPISTTDLWNVLRDRFPAASPKAVREICDWLASQDILTRFGGDGYRVVRASELADTLRSERR